MNWRLALLRIHVPGFLKRRGLIELCHRTARAFADPRLQDAPASCGGLEGGRYARGSPDRLGTAGAGPKDRVPPLSKARTYPAMLAAYAGYTRDRAQAALQDGRDLRETEVRLRNEAREMGRGLRRKLRLRNEDDFRAALRLFYRTLGIDLRVAPCGETVVRRCFFSQYYSVPVCRLLSALDDGLVEGLSGGRRLRFMERITEGYHCCRAVIE